MTDWSAALFPPLAGLKRSLDDVDGPLAKRMRAVYYLRTLASPEALTALSTALLDRRNSPLMRHEPLPPNLASKAEPSAPCPPATPASSARFSAARSEAGRRCSGSR